MSLISYLLNESKKWKSGGFPFFIKEDGVVRICLFISSNSAYGGAAPQMSKGNPDPGETPLIASAREVSEETGIPLAAFISPKEVGSYNFKGEVEDYVMHVFGFEMSKEHAPKSNDEGTGKWFDADDAVRLIRKSQKPFLEELLAKISPKKSKIFKKPDWRKPNKEELQLEYQLEYVNKNLGKMTGNKWPDVDTWLASASDAKLTKITPAMDDKMGYRSHTSSRASLVNLLKSYASWPVYRNEKSVERLYNGVENGETLPAPVVLKFPDGRLRIFGGNTRADVFRQTYPGEPYEALIMEI